MNQCNMVKPCIKNQSEICRLCLTFTKTCFSLIEDSGASGMLEALTSLRILPSDDISTVMCLKCYLNLKLAFSIQQNMLRAEQRFREHRFVSPIKQECDIQHMKSDEIVVEPDVDAHLKDERNDTFGEHVCNLCGKKWSTKGDLDKHKRGVHVQKQCPVCGKVLKRPCFKRHLEEVHSIYDREVELEKHICDICGIEKSTKRKLDGHKRATHMVAACPVCNEKIGKLQLKKHVLEHHASSAEESETIKNILQDYTCETCSKKYPSKHLLNNHKYNVHVSEKCPICEKEFKKAHINEHIARHGKLNTQPADVEPNLNNGQTEPNHAPTGKYICDICGKKKFSQIDLKKHKYNVHLRAECPICKKTISQTNIKRHIERHNDPLTVCELCGVSVLQQDLRVHMYNNHTIRKLKCNFCDKIFKKNCDRTTHEKRDHLGQADFTCDTCGKRFYKSVYLKKHIQSTHLKMRPHLCEFCNVGFSSSFALKTHRRQHTNEKPFKCEFCAEGFRQKVSLKSHLKSQHNVEEELNFECKECGKKFASSAALISHGRIHS